MRVLLTEVGWWPLPADYAAWQEADQSRGDSLDESTQPRRGSPEWDVWDAVGRDFAAADGIRTGSLRLHKPTKTVWVRAADQSWVLLRRVKPDSKAEMDAFLFAKSLGLAKDSTAHLSDE